MKREFEVKKTNNLLDYSKYCIPLAWLHPGLAFAIPSVVAVIRVTTGIGSSVAGRGILDRGDYLCGRSGGEFYVRFVEQLFGLQASDKLFGVPTSGENVKPILIWQKQSIKNTHLFRVSGHALYSANTSIICMLQEFLQE